MGGEGFQGTVVDFWIRFRKVVMATSIDPAEEFGFWSGLVKSLAVGKGDRPIGGTMENKDGAGDPGNP